MRKESKVIVSVRLLTGDSVDVSVKTVDTNFSKEDYTILLKKIKNKGIQIFKV